MEERLVNQKLTSFDDEEQTLRPQKLSEYVGQSELKEMLNIYITTAKIRHETVIYHVLYNVTFNFTFKCFWIFN